LAVLNAKQTALLRRERIGWFKSHRSHSHTMRSMRRVKNDEAVSPVIATVLLLAITVMLSSMVFVLMQGALTTTEKSAPQATVSVRGLSNGFHVVRLTSLDQTIDPAKLQWNLAPDSLDDGNPLGGKVADADVYGLIGANVSFHDRDAGYSVSQGDYFVIDSTTIGSDTGTWRFKLVDTNSQSVLVNVMLPPLDV